MRRFERVVALPDPKKLSFSRRINSLEAQQNTSSTIRSDNTLIPAPPNPGVLPKSYCAADVKIRLEAGPDKPKEVTKEILS